MCSAEDDPTQHDRELSVASDIARARALGLTLIVNVEADRVPVDRRDPAIACPLCDDGILTITHPRRCRECMAVGL